MATPRLARKSLPHMPRSMSTVTPVSPAPLNKSRASTQPAKGGAKSPRPLTPVSTQEGSKKKERVPTPTVARARHSSTRSSLSSLSSSLHSIAEEVRTDTIICNYYGVNSHYIVFTTDHSSSNSQHLTETQFGMYHTISC